MTRHLIWMSLFCVQCAAQSILLEQPKTPVETKTAPPVKKKSSKKQLPGRLTAVNVKARASAVMLTLKSDKPINRPEFKQLQNPDRMVFDFKSLTMSKKAKRLLKAGWLGKIRLGAHPDKIRLVVDLDKGVKATYGIKKTTSGYQINFTRSQGKAPKKQTGLITIDLRDADVRNAFKLIADASGANIVVSDQVTGSVSLVLKDVAWRDAIKVLAQTQNLILVETGNVIQILPKNIDNGAQCQIGG